MRILFVLKRFHTYQYFSVKALLDHGHEVQILVQRVAAGEEHSLVKPTVLPPAALTQLIQRLIPGRKNRSMFRMRYGMASPVALWRAMRAFEPDLVLLGKLRGFAAGAALIAALQRRRRVLFDYTPATKERFGPLRSIVRAVGIEPKARFSLVSGLSGPEKPFRLSNGVYHIPPAIEPPDEPPPPRPRSPRRTRLLCVGGYAVERKRHDLLLEAFGRLAERYPLELGFVGGGSPEHPRVQALKARAEQLGLADRVEFRFNLPYAEVMRTYLAYDVFILPARDEPFGVVVPEAMAYGMPIICSDSCGSRDSLELGVNGELFKTDDLADLTSTIERLVADPERIRAMGAASSRIIAERHLPSVYNERLMQIAADIDAKRAGER